jgi:hypothetical protein
MSREKMPPTWAIGVGSILILGHLFCALIATLSQMSGPWPVFNAPTPMADQSLPPYFAVVAGEWVAPYQAAFKTNSAFHFNSSRQENQEISFEVALKDEKGIIKSKLQIPDPNASSAIQYRQRFLAQQLGGDIDLPPMTSVQIAAQGTKLPDIRWWNPESETRFVLKSADPNSVPRNQMFRQPSPWQFIVAKSFTRHLHQAYPGNKLEITRYWQQPIMPSVLLERESLPPDLLRRYQSSYGELSP